MELSVGIYFVHFLTVKGVFEQILYERYVLECGRKYMKQRKEILSESRVIIFIGRKERVFNLR